MSTNPTQPNLPTADRLQEIRDADASAGEDLRFCPSAWSDRRDLLATLEHQQNGIDERARRVLTGSMLYDMYTEAHAARNCSVDSWKELSEEDRQTWAHVAATITMAFHQ